MPAPCVACCAASTCLHRRDERVERANLAEVRDRLRAIGIVEAEDRRLREEVGGAEARRMIGVAFDLRRPALVALDEQADAGRRQTASPSRRRAACRERAPRAAGRTERSLRPAGACRRSRRPAPATRPSASGSRGGRPGSSHSEAFCGNSRCRNSLNSGVSATASRLRQYSRPRVPSSLARSAWMSFGSFMSGSPVARRAARCCP